MSSDIGKFNKIRCIVRITQMLRQWKKRAVCSSSKRIAPDVPVGHVAISVGSSCRRFVVRATYLNHPIFRKLLIQAEEEYGFSNNGTLAIPCDELLFEEILRFVSRSRSCNVNPVFRRLKMVTSSMNIVDINRPSRLQMHIYFMRSINKYNSIVENNYEKTQQKNWQSTKRRRLS